MLFFAVGLYFATAIHGYLQRYAPSNALVARVRCGHPRVRVALGLLALSAVLVLAAVSLRNWAASGGPGWLHLVVLVAVWDAFKFTVLAIGVFLRCARIAFRWVSVRP